MDQDTTDNVEEGGVIGATYATQVILDHIKNKIIISEISKYINLG